MTVKIPIILIELLLYRAEVQRQQSIIERELKWPWILGAFV